MSIATLVVQGYSEWIQKPSKYILGILVTLAMLIGLAAIILYPPGKDQGGTDNWWPIVLNVAHGQGLSSCQVQYFPFCANAHQETASREPLPILMYAFVAILTNDSLIATAFLNLLVFIGVLLAIYKIANLLSGQVVAAIASLGWVLYLPGYRLIPQVAGDLLATLCFSWAIYMFMRGLREQRLKDWALVGLLLGLSAMSRSVLLFVGAALLGGFLLYTILRRRDCIRHSVIAIAVMLLCLMPWAMRNLHVFGFPLIGTTLSGYNLYRHNAIIEGDSWLHYTSPNEGAALVEELLRTVPLRGDENEYEMNEVFTKEAGRIIREYPQRYIVLSLYRFLPLWFDIGINEAYGQSPSTLDRLSMPPQFTILILSIIGIVIAWRYTWPLWLSIVVVNAMHMAVNARVRFLVVVIPLLLVYSSIAFVYFVKHIIARLKKPSSSLDIDIANA